MKKLSDTEVEGGRKEMSDRLFFPELFNCPHCNEPLELTLEARECSSFQCPYCDKLVLSKEKPVVSTDMADQDAMNERSEPVSSKEKCEQDPISIEDVKPSSSVPKLIDALTVPILTIGTFHGLQAYLNSDSGSLQIELGLGMFLKLLFIYATFYGVIMRPILKAIFRKQADTPEVHANEKKTAPIQKPTSGTLAWRCACGEVNLKSAGSCRKCGELKPHPVVQSEEDV
ncbi:MAG: hypothetical protein KKG33_04270 [candidate division Zixibacteria bacterium]|nr:hypothetical protein [candidate division Zixibacteria bacterium]MBU1470330.1 hypothetical protein [candidate division Zixibacteria bacterium]MBU2624761.1 hypothetical protein [candidate division Zixibacteria bacterium]